MQNYIIIWSHRHGISPVLFKTKREINDYSEEAAWKILEELGHDIEPDRMDEHIEDFSSLDPDEFQLLP